MKERPCEFGHQPFRKLKKLLKEAAGKEPAAAAEISPAGGASLSRPGTVSGRNFGKLFQEPQVEDDAIFFTRAMADVTPLHREEKRPQAVAAAPSAPSAPKPARKKSDKLQRLNFQQLVQNGIGGAVAGSNAITAANSQTCFAAAISEAPMDPVAGGRLDLHGYVVAEAKVVFDNFLREAIAGGRKEVLVIHGKGLSSPGEPVLKHQVSDWLTRGQWRRWVASFSYAKPRDGGPGATHVLLRRHAG